LADLLIFLGSEEPIELKPGTDFFLDRMFLTGSNGDNRYSARHAPRLFSDATDWYVENRQRDITLRLIEGGQIASIGPGLSRKLEVEYSELLIVQTKVGLELRRDESASPDRVSAAEPPTLDGPRTETGEEAIESSLRAFLAKKPQVRTIVYVRFQQYISEDPIYSRSPQHLTAEQVLLCYPGAKDVSTIHQAQRDISNLTGLRLHELGPWLVSRGLLLASHNIDIPHVNCGHWRNGHRY
jgi:hypothetical protein